MEPAPPPPLQGEREGEVPEQQQLDEIELEGEGEEEEVEKAPPSLLSRATRALGKWGVRGKEMIAVGWGWALSMVNRTGNTTRLWVETE